MYHSFRWNNIRKHLILRWLKPHKRHSRILQNILKGFSIFFHSGLEECNQNTCCKPPHRLEWDLALAKQAEQPKQFVVENIIFAVIVGNKMVCRCQRSQYLH
ncbi:hypothetical protein SUGI_0115180 [Cryptomeria japonica]|nr:hypothetical protein SUGI_0115180 [Cryptomeria japonica]